jgi:putative ABC transport system permease protein
LKTIRLYLRLFIESMRMAYGSLVSNKLRSFLSVLGITIGIFLVILVFTLVDSLETNIKQSVQSLGKNVIYIDKWEWSGGGSTYPWWKYLNRPDAKLDEVESLKKYPVVNYLEAISYTSNKIADVKKGVKTVEGVSIDGYTQAFSKIETLELEVGRYFNDFEDLNGKAVAVIGHNVAKGLFDKPTDAIGQNISILGKQTLVIGIFKYQGDNLINIDFDDKIAVPIRFLEYATGTRGGGRLIIKINENINEDLVYYELLGAMRSIRRLKPSDDDNFSLNKISFLTETIGDFFKSVNTFGLIIGMFSLLVGGFGVANIMFVSVKERTAIIGIQKALGAKNEFILIQFLTEAVILSLLGGLIGVLITSGLSVTINVILEKIIESSFRLIVSKENIFIGLLFSSIIGLLSGFIPAYSASKLQPVEAMRNK